MTKPIKIALCLSGEPRYSMFCFPYIYESFINLGNKYEVDVFCYFRKPFRAFYSYKPKSYLYDTFYEKEVWKFIDNIKLPDVLQKNKNFYDSYTQQTNLIINPILMFDGMYKSFKIANDYSNYDIYIRSRYDFFTKNQIQLHPVLEKIQEKKFDLFIPEKEKTLNGIENIEYSDQFAIGNFKGMERYVNVLSDLNNLLEITKEWRGERWLFNYLNNSNVRIHQEYMELNLIREVVIGTDTFSPDPTYIDI